MELLPPQKYHIYRPYYKIHKMALDLLALGYLCRTFMKEEKTVIHEHRHNKKCQCWKCRPDLHPCEEEGPGLKGILICSATIILLIGTIYILGSIYSYLNKPKPCEMIKIDSSHTYYDDPYCWKSLQGFPGKIDVCRIPGVEYQTCHQGVCYQFESKDDYVLKCKQEYN